MSTYCGLADKRGRVQVGDKMATVDFLRSTSVELVAEATGVEVSDLLNLARGLWAPLGLNWLSKDHSCEDELKSRPDYSIGWGTPAVFNCSCGKTWVYVNSEAEGAWWERRPAALGPAQGSEAKPSPKESSGPR